MISLNVRELPYLIVSMLLITSLFAVASHVKIDNTNEVKSSIESFVVPSIPLEFTNDHQSLSLLAQDVLLMSASYVSSIDYHGDHKIIEVVLIDNVCQVTLEVVNTNKITPYSVECRKNGQ